MEQMTAFDRQIAAEVLREAGPANPVDDLAVFEAVVAANQSQRRGFTMFSAFRFIVASVIVALFGGFLLSGFLTTPQGNEMAPAAETDSPSPMTTEELLSTMVTEEVEPGVERIVSDGAGHDLDAGGPRSHLNGISIGPDGTVWVQATYHEASSAREYPQVWALGQPGTYTHDDGLPMHGMGDLVVRRDGSLLVLTDNVLDARSRLLGTNGILRFDGDRFVPDEGPMLRELPGGGLLLLMEGFDAAHMLSEGQTGLEYFPTIRAVWRPDDRSWTMLDDGVAREARTSSEWPFMCWIGAELPFPVADTRVLDAIGIAGISLPQASEDGVACRREGAWGAQPSVYLQDTYIGQIVAGPDGSVWAVGDHDGEPRGLYRISPMAE